MLELVRGEGVVAGHEGKVVGQVGRMWALVRHVARGRFVLFAGFESDGEVKAAAGDFGGGEVPEAVFQGAEVCDEFVAGECKAVVENGEGGAAADCVNEVGADGGRGLGGVQRGLEGCDTAAVVEVELLEAILDDEVIVAALVVFSVEEA